MIHQKRLSLSVVLLACCSPLAAVEIRFGNSIEFVHPDEVETVQYCRKAGIGYNLNNQTSNPGGGGIVDTKEGRIIVLYLRDDHAMTVEQLKPLLKATHLSSFGCPSWATDETLGFFTHPGRFPKVTGLSIYGSKITDKGLAGLKNFPQVASLNLRSDAITDRGVQHLCQVPTFSFLRLNCSHITDKGVAYLPNLPELFFLELKTTQTTDDGLEALSRLPKLTTLYLDHTQVTGSGLRHLASLKKLRWLGLDNTPFNDRGLGELAEHPSLRKMEVLYLGNTRITDAGCPAFEQLNRLRVLNLSGTAVSDRGVRHLRNMPQLYNIQFGDRVTSEGKRWLAENAHFAAGLQSQLLRYVPKPKSQGMDLQAFRSSLQGVDALVYQLGAKDASEAQAKLRRMGAVAVERTMAMAEKSQQAGHPLRGDKNFQWYFARNAAAVLAETADGSMSMLADHYAKSVGARPVISRTLSNLKSVGVLEDWLEHESPLVRQEALRQMSRRARYWPLGPGAASPSTLRHGSLRLTVTARKRVHALLADADVQVRRAACQVIIAANEELAAKADAFVAATLRETDTVTVARLVDALYAIADQRPVGDKRLPVLIGSLAEVMTQSENEHARYIAARRLGKLGGKSQVAAPQLEVVKNGPDKELGVTASHALEQIRRCPITLMRAADIPLDVQALVFALTTYDRETTDEAAAALKKRGPSVVQALAIASRGETHEYYSQKAGRLAAHWDQEAVLPLLRPAFNWTTTTTRLFVIHAISEMKWTELPEVVEDSLHGIDAKVRSQMRRSLPQLANNVSGQAAKELAPLLAKELKNPELDWPLARELTRSLASYYPSVRETPDLLIGVLRQDSKYASAYACEALVELSRKHLADQEHARDKIAAAIRGMLRTTENGELQKECARALQQFKSAD